MQVTNSSPVSSSFRPEGSPIMLLEKMQESITKICHEAQKIVNAHPEKKEHFDQWSDRFFKEDFQPKIIKIISIIDTNPEEAALCVTSIHKSFYVALKNMLGNINPEFSKKLNKLIELTDKSTECLKEVIDECLKSEEYKQAYENLLKLDAKEKERRKKKKQRRTNKAALEKEKKLAEVQQSKKAPDYLNVSKEKKAECSAILQQPPSKEEQKALFFANLQRPSAFRHRERVTRWMNSDPTSIRKFSDRKDGQIVFQYAGDEWTAEKIAKIRAQHYLPGTERLAQLPYRDIYSYPTARGFAMFAEFSYKGQSETGIIHFGCQQKTIYHRMFTSSNFSREEMFNNNFPVSPKSEAATQEDFQQAKVTITPEENNCILFEYLDEGYSVRVFPMKPELVEQLACGSIYNDFS